MNKIMYGPRAIPSIVFFLGFVYLGVKEFLEKGMTPERAQEVVLGIVIIPTVLWIVGFIMDYDAKDSPTIY